MQTPGFNSRTVSVTNTLELSSGRAIIDAFGAVDPGLAERPVVFRVADEVGHPVEHPVLDPVLVHIDDHKGPVRAKEVFGQPVTHAAEPADDVVIAEPVNLFLHVASLEPVAGEKTLSEARNNKRCNADADHADHYSHDPTGI